MGKRKKSGTIPMLFSDAEVFKFASYQSAKGEIRAEIWLVKSELILKDGVFVHESSVKACSFFPITDLIADLAKQGIEVKHARDLRKPLKSLYPQGEPEVIDMFKSKTAHVLVQIDPPSELLQHQLVQPLFPACDVVDVNTAVLICQQHASLRNVMKPFKHKDVAHGLRQLQPEG